MILVMMVLHLRRAMQMPPDEHEMNLCMLFNLYSDSNFLGN